MRAVARPQSVLGNNRDTSQPLRWKLTVRSEFVRKTSMSTDGVGKIPSHKGWMRYAPVLHSTFDRARTRKICLSYVCSTSFVHNTLLMKFNFKPPARKRFSSGDFVTGDTGPHMSSGCIYWANSIAASDNCAKEDCYMHIHWSRSMHMREW